MFFIDTYIVECYYVCMDDKIKITITIVFATRYRRCIFKNKEVSKFCTEHFKSVCDNLNVDIIYLMCTDDHVIISCHIPLGLTAEALAAKLKRCTSKPVREKFAEFCRMPSLWQKKIWWDSGQYNIEMEHKIEKFLQTLPDRY